jgi:hypothetical protein
VRRLLAKGAEVRVLARDPARAEERFGRGKVEIARGDSDDPGSVAPALEGATKLFLIAPGPNRARAGVRGDRRGEGGGHIAHRHGLVAGRRDGGIGSGALHASGDAPGVERTVDDPAADRVHVEFVVLPRLDPLGGHRKGQPDSPGAHRGGRRRCAHDRRTRGPGLQAHERRGARDGGRRFVAIYFSVIDEMLLVRKPSTLAIHGGNRRQT